jgi:uncharacterized protein YjiS (DUF1127 family)
MTTYDLHDIAADRRSIPDLMDGFKRLVTLIDRNRRRYRTLQAIAHLDADQLRDIGLEPDDVAEAMNGNGEVLWTKIQHR